VSRIEKAWRWCRRKPALAGSLAAAACLLLIVAIGSPIAALRISQARQQAEADKKQAQAEAAKSHQVAQFLKEMIQGVGPSVAKGRDTTILREVLESAIERIGKDLKDHPEVEAELEATMAKVYWEIGDYEKSETLLRRVAELLRKLPGNEQSMAQAMNDLAVVLNKQGKSAEAEAMHRDVLLMRKRLLGNDHEDVGESLNNLAAVLWSQGKLKEAEPLYQEALTVWKKHVGKEHQLICFFDVCSGYQP